MDRLEQLIAAAGSNNLLELSRLIHEGIDINGINENQLTALMQAATFGHISAVEILLQAGAKIIIADNNKMNAYELAKLFGRHKIAEMFDHYMQFEKHMASSTNNLSSTDATILNEVFNNHKGDDAIADFEAVLVEQEAEEVKEIPEYFHQFTELTHFDKNKQSNTDEDAVQINTSDDFEIKSQISLDEEDSFINIQLKLDDEESDSTFFETASNELINDFESEETELTSENQNMITVEELFDAVEINSVNVLKKLIEQGADVNLADSYGWTAIMLAARQDKQQIAEYLISQAADVNQVSLSGWSALRIAASSGYLNMVKILIASGADVYFTNAKGETALSTAQKYGQDEVVQYIQEL